MHTSSAFPVLPLLVTLLLGFFPVACESSESAMDSQDADLTIPPDISSLSVSLFSSLLSPWDTMTFDLTQTPATYTFQRHATCERTGTITIDEDQELRASIRGMHYAQFATTFLRADQPYRQIVFNRGDESVRIYHLFDEDWELEWYPEKNYYYATAGADELIEVAMRSGSCD